MTGPELREFRHQLGLSQARLAALLDVTPNTIARWERGELAIASPRMLRLALERLADTLPQPSGDPLRFKPHTR